MPVLREGGMIGDIAVEPEPAEPPVCQIDRVGAIEALRLRKNLRDATLTVDSEASPEYLDQLDVKNGQILSIVPL
jgi:hypothetical protein